ncbi:MAG TPA: HDIG domain-containing protein [Chloroflexota bacterium]|nr:HDIG domain-containing protein [Chloroflexota bacterium]
MERERAYGLLTEYVKGEGLIKHCLAVEAAMRAYAVRYDGDPNQWGLAGLLHDFDWEIHPNAEEHPTAGAPILREAGVSDEIIYAIQAHAEYLQLERMTWMDKCLPAVDELAGFIIAVALVRPSKSLRDVDVSSVKKKMKDKAFARAVRREDITAGAELLGVNLDDHIATVLTAMRGIAPELGLE